MLEPTPLYGGNAEFLDALYEQYLHDPASVAQRWRSYFGQLTPAGAERAHAPIRDAIKQRAMLARGVILAVSAAVGSPEDPIAAMKAFLSQPVKVPRQTFFYQMADLLYEQSSLFDANHIDRPDRQMVMYKVALAALSSIEQADDAEALAARIHEAIKKLPGV